MFLICFNILYLKPQYSHSTQGPATSYSLQWEGSTGMLSGVRRRYFDHCWWKTSKYTVKTLGKWLGMLELSTCTGWNICQQTSRNWEWRSFLGFRLIVLIPFLILGKSEGQHAKLVRGLHNQGFRVSEIGYGFPLWIKVILIQFWDYPATSSIIFDSFICLSNIKVNYAGGQGIWILLLHVPFNDHTT